MSEVNIKTDEEIKALFDYSKGLCRNLDKDEPTIEDIAEFYYSNKENYIEEYGDDETYSYKNYCEDLLYSGIVYE